MSLQKQTESLNLCSDLKKNITHVFSYSMQEKGAKPLKNQYGPFSVKSKFHEAGKKFSILFFSDKNK